MTIDYQIRGKVAVVTIDRANKRNALNAEVVQVLNESFKKADLDQSVGCILLTANGPAFCAGSDLKALAGKSPQEMADIEQAKSQLTVYMSKLSKPIICAVEGYALGGGLVLAMTCDVVVCAENAKLHLPEVKNGWIPPWGLKILSDRLGISKAKQLAWGVNPLTANDAYRIGLVEHVVPQDTTLPYALQLAQQYAGLPKAAVASVKTFFNRVNELTPITSDELSSKMFIENCSHEVAQQTLISFTGKK